MIVVKLMGGMGNQMFQYAAGRALAQANGDVLKLDLSHYLNPPPGDVPRKYELYNFRISAETANDADLQRFCRYGGLRGLLARAKGVFSGGAPCFLAERDMRYDPRIREARGDVYLDGYWQSERYFETIEGLIRAELQPACSGSDRVMRLWEEIQGANSVCINVRRGDFVSSSFHGCFGMDYFEKGRKILEQSIRDLRYYVFSDDVAWCKEQFSGSPGTTVVTHDYAGPDFIDYLFLMTSCKHFIIPNSSFAWWAAWLCSHQEKRVIAPARWFNDPKIDTSDLVPGSWTRI